MEIYPMDILSPIWKITVGWRRMIKNRALSEEVYTQFAVWADRNSGRGGGPHNLLPHQP